MDKKENILVSENSEKIEAVLENDDSQVEEAAEDIAVVAKVQETAQVSETDIIDIQIDEAFPYTSGEDFYNHTVLRNRDQPGSHPIGAISGLREELDYIRSYKRVYSTENGLAEFIRWNDANPSWADRSGYFVKLVFDVNTGVERAEICTDKDDVYGVAVRNSGFVGNQINDANGAGHSDDLAYAMVGIVGLLRVRTDGTAQIGDYVVPSSAGIATKSEHSCGYRVISTGSYPSYPYVTIAVTPQNDKINKIYGTLMESNGTIGNISLRIDAIESEITSSSNKVDVAIKDMEELKDLMGECEVEVDRIDKLTNETNGIVQEALATVEQTIKSANDAKNAAQAAAQDAKQVVTDLANMSDLADSMEDIIGYAYVDKDGNTYSSAAGLIKLANETHVNYGILAQQVSEQGDDLAGMIVAVDKKHGASIQHLVSHIDKYAIGEISLSYGLTEDEANSILQNDYIYVPTSNHSETIGNKTITFERGFAYTWDSDNITWIKGAAVSTATTYFDGTSVGDLWYCWQDVETDEVDYLAETLYRWSGSDWIAVATIRDNHQNRLVSSVKQTADGVKTEVVDARNGATSLKVHIDGINAVVQDNQGYISNLEQTAQKIAGGVYSPADSGSYFQMLTAENASSLNAINYGRFHVVHQSFLGATPAAAGNKYTVPPTWNEATKQFEFNAGLADANGAYYFHSEDKTKYVKVVDGGYEIYTIGNLATASYDSRITENEANIALLTQYKTENTNAVAAIKATADANKASIAQLAQYDEENTKSIAAIKADVAANSASIGLVVTNGKVDGGLIINAINGASNAYIDADNIVFGKGVGSNNDDNFYLKLTSSEATMRNGSLNIHKGNFSILLDPTNGIQMKNGNSDIFFFKPDGSAKIGSWNVAGDRLYSGSGTNYMALSAADPSYYVWAGSDTAASAPFSVTKAGKLNATGAKISGDITMTGGSISWANISETGKSAAYELAEGASTAASKAQGRADDAYSYAGTANDLATAIKEGTCTGTFIDHKSLYSPSIVGGYFRTAGSNEYTYSAMKTDGFYIYHESTMSEGADPLDQIPKMKLSVNNEDGMSIRVEVGAGEGKTGDYADSGKLILSKTVEETANGLENVGKIYIGYNDGYYGFKLRKNTLELLPGTKFRGAIEWDSVNESDSGAYKTAQSASSYASSAYDGLSNLVQGKYYSNNGTFINGNTICSARFYAVSPNNNTNSVGAFSSMTGDGFAIYRDASGEIPKLELLVSNDHIDGQNYGSTIRVAVGAGEFGDTAGSWAEAGRLILEKQWDGTDNLARIYFKGKGKNGNEKFLGFYFDYNGISLIDEGTRFNFNKGTVDFTNATVDFKNATVTGLDSATGAVFG